ncbi:MAG TPA: hypothetical protein VJN94_03900 [Candidatus Binataceae bacterium]|nr:hypothetical protein [Candidatus Binataceae bacterium]
MVLLIGARPVHPQPNAAAVPAKPEPYSDQRWIGSLKPSSKDNSILSGQIFDLGHCWHRLAIDTRTWQLTIDSRDTCKDPDHGISMLQLTPVVHNEQIAQGMYYHLPDCRAEWEGGTFQLFRRHDGTWTLLIDGFRGPGISPRDCKAQR